MGKGRGGREEGRSKKVKRGSGRLERVGGEGGEEG